MKIRSAISLILALILMFSFMNVSAEIISYPLGDIDGDNTVSSVDYLMVKRACFNTLNLDCTQKQCADVNQDEKIDSIDYTLIKRHCMKNLTILGSVEFEKNDSYLGSFGSDAGHIYEHWESDSIPTYTVPRHYRSACSFCNEEGFIDLGCLVETKLEIQQEILRLVNIEREKAGVPALKYYYSAQIALDARAQELLLNFSHERPDGNKCYTVLNDYNIDLGLTLGENIAYGYPTAESVMEGWMNSPGHRANILNPNFTAIAVGEYSYHWVQMFFG